MVKLKSATVLSQKANSLIYRSIFLRNELRHLRFEKRKLLRATGRAAKSKSNGRVTSLNVGLPLSSSELTLAARALRKEVIQLRKELARKRLDCLKHLKSCSFRPEFINCEHFTWEQRLHLSLYRSVEAVLFNFDYRVHGAAASLLAKKFESEFSVLPDVRTRTLRFKRRSSSSSE
jgi:hypothetical protein